MKLQNTKKIFRDAIKKHYAVGAFNFVNLEGLKAIICAQQIEKCPVIVQCSTGAIKYAGAKTLVAMAKSMDSDYPVVLSLDHGKTFEDCKNAIDAGFTNVMIDTSSLSFEENVKLTSKVVEYAHMHNVTVEAELGVLAGVEDEVSADTNIYTDPDKAYEFVARTNVDSLAIAIGTSHGTHKFKGEAKLRFDILSQIEQRLPDFPLVLHGASSIPQNMVKLAEQYGAILSHANGVPEVLLKEACTKHNICKVNVDSDLRLAYTAGVREYLSNNKQDVDLRNYNKNGMKYITDVVAYKMHDVFSDKVK